MISSKAKSFMLPALYCLFFIIVQFAVGQDITKAPKVPPDGCSPLQASNLENSSDSPTAISIERQLSVLSLGHDALLMGIKALDDLTVTTSANITGAVGSFIEGFNLARNDYLCAAYLLGRASTQDKEQQTYMDLEISVFNRLAGLVSYMANRSLDHLSHPDRNTPVAAQVESGKQFGEVLKARDDAYSDLADTTIYVSMRAFDMSGPKDKPVKFLQLSCAEQSKLKQKAEAMHAAVPEDDFTKNAGLYVAVLGRYQCHP